MFVDLVGSTALVASADPEVVRRRVRAISSRSTDCVEAHGGVVEKFAGDAVLAAFGVPQAHEDDAERAIKAAFAILDQVHELGLEARVGHRVGRGRRRRRSPVDLRDRRGRQRRGAAAAAGVARRGPDRPRRARALLPGNRRGGGRPVRAQGPERPDPRLAGRLRRHPLGQLVERPRAADRPRIRARAARQHLRPHGARPPRAPVHGLRRGRRRQEPARARVRRRARGRHGPRRSLPAVRRGHHVLAAGRDGQDRRRASPTTTRSRRRSRSSRPTARTRPSPTCSASPPACWRRSTASARRRRSPGPPGPSSRSSPRHSRVVLGFEDIHWAEEPLLELIEHLADWVRAPLLILCLARAELLDVHPGWGGGRVRATAIELEALGRSESELLVEGAPGR